MTCLLRSVPRSTIRIIQSENVDASVSQDAFLPTAMTHRPVGSSGSSTGWIGISSVVFTRNSGNADENHFLYCIKTIDSQNNS